MTHFESSIKLLRETFNSGATRSIDWRLTQLSQLEKMIVEHREQIHAALKSDLGKCDFEANIAETSVIENDIQYIRKHLKRWMRPRRVPSPMLTWPARSWIQPEPLGVICVLGAYNYPFNLLVRPLLAAIAAGNCAVVKPSEIASATSQWLMEYLPKYLDPSAVICVEGDGEVAASLLTHRFDHIFYTGSGTIGKKVLAAAAPHLTPVTLELGGKSPCLVDDTCDIEMTARRIVWSKWLNAGQTCIAPDYVMVHQSKASALIDAIKHTLVKFYGNNAEKSADYGRVISQKQQKRLVSLLKDQNIIWGGQHNDESRYLAPTLVLAPDPKSSLMKEEIFGPILPIIPVNNVDDMVTFVKAGDKPLATYCYSRDSQFQERVVTEISAGNMCINDGMMFMANHELPFGGVGDSGMGRYAGKFGFDTFSHQKSVMKRYFAFDVPVRYPPFTQKKASLMNWLRRF